MAHIYVAIVCLVAIVAAVAILAISERAERKAYEKMFETYKEMFDKCMSEFKAVVDLSESLQKANDEFCYDNDELRDALNERDEELEKKEKRIKELEAMNDRISKQMSALFEKGVDYNGKEGL